MIINKVIKKYKKFSLNFENVEIDKIGLVGLIGDNGSGKTTLMNILSGKIKANEIDVKIFDSTSIYGNESVYKNSFYMSANTKYGGKLKSIIEDFEVLFHNFDTQKCNSIIKVFNLDCQSKFSSLSQGMKAQFLLAIAQSLPIEVLYLDEITNGLDMSSRSIVYENIKVLAKSKLVFLSTHILDKNMTYFDRILFLEKGRLLFDVKNNQTLIKENDAYKVVDSSSIGENIDYDIIEVYKAMSEEKARRILNE